MPLMFCAAIAASCSAFAVDADRLMYAAAPASPYAALQEEVLAEINRLRANPRGYTATLQRYGRFFRANLVIEPGEPETLTEEGVAPVQEAIRSLARQHEVGPLSASTMLAAAADDHCNEQGRDGSLGHASSDGSTPGDRSERHGGGRYVGEVITYGSTAAADVVRQLIVDDGVPDRGHRSLLLAPDLRFAGVACGPHPAYRQVCVIDLARTEDGRSVAEAAQGGGMQLAAR